MAAAAHASEKDHYADAEMQLEMKAAEFEVDVDTLQPLTDQLRKFLVDKDKQTRTDRHETTIFFEEEGRRGYLQCKYVHNGTALFDRPLYEKVDEAQPMLNITHVVIGRPTEGAASSKNLLARVCEELIPETNLAGIRIESILSHGFLRALLLRGWIEHDRNSSAILHNPKLKPVGGRRTRKKSKRRRAKSRKFYKR